MPETTLSAKPSREALKQQLRDEARRQLTPNEFAQCEKIIHNAVLGSTGVGVAKLAVGLTAGWRAGRHGACPHGRHAAKAGRALWLSAEKDAGSNLL